jgi:hypothetical protein
MSWLYCPPKSRTITSSCDIEISFLLKTTVFAFYQLYAGKKEKTRPE